MEIAIILLISIGVIYNLIKRTEIMYRVNLVKSNYISLFIILILLLFVVINIIHNKIYGYSIMIVLILYTISGMISKGFNRRGVYTTGNITFLIKFIKWKDIKNMKIEYNKDGYVDLLLSTERMAFKHRYKESVDEVLFKIKKELKL